MGRFDFTASRVHRAATELLAAKRLLAPPPWYDIVADYPPAQTLVRPLQRVGQARTKKNVKKPSKMFQPMRLAYKEDYLRREFFSDHPWELARPRVILEDSGNDSKHWNWENIEQSNKPLDGESVIQRQMYLMRRGASKEEAYDQARKEFYEKRTDEDIERRIAKEEALAVGAYFGKSPVEYGMELEDKAYDDWKEWAEKEILLVEQQTAAAYGGGEASAVEADGKAAPMIEAGETAPLETEAAPAFASAR
ncbi:mitochondrial 37S ribosomal protein mS23 [Phyllosticta citribraziliensis]|uniref:Small ribosomal subunit protein mS23 n=1 Tax=Phyllosticta citribraziliensis TaxID=989973 RepID=A0ABR1LAP9_9PEZI